MPTPQRIRRAFLTLLTLLFGLGSQAQVFTGTAGVIRNDSTMTSFPITVSGLANMSYSYGLARVSLTLTHPAVQELHIYLKSPTSYVAALSVSNGNGANYTNTVFENQASVSIRNANPPFTGSFIPENSLAVFNSGGITTNGAWSVMILDDQKNQNSGSVQSVSIEFNATPAQPTPLTQSNLPLFVINTQGKTIPTISDIQCQMYILDNPSGSNKLLDTQTTKVLPIGIHIRGNSSASGLKDPYSFSPKDIHGEDSNMSVLGMPSENDWILNNSFQDQSFMKDVLTYYLSNRMGRYASRTRFCELVINGEYRGLYCLMERIKQDKHRVDIANLKPTDTAGADVTGGYILKKDGSPGIKDSGFVHPLSGFTYLYDDPDSPVIQQKKYIKSWMDTAVGALLNVPFFDTLFGYRHYVDYKSAMDYFILNEYGVSGDTYNRSTYWHKQKITKDNKLYFGPVWDFNFGFNTPTSALKFPSFTPWKKMYDDTFFKREIWCRYNTVRATALNISTINKVLDSCIAPLSQAIFRNDERWTHTATGNGVTLSFYKDACNYLKKYSFERLAFMDSAMRGNCVYGKTCPPIMQYEVTNACTGDSALLKVNTTASSVSLSPSTGTRKIGKYTFMISHTLVGPISLVWNNCQGFDSISLNLSSTNKPVIQVLGPDTIKEGDSALLTVTGARWFSWTSPYIPVNTINDSVYAKPAITTTYTITGFNGAGCSSVITKTIVVVPRNPLIVKISPDSLCAGDLLTLKASGADQIYWDINNKIYVTDSLTLRPTSDVIIKITGMMNGNISDYQVRTIKVFPKPALTIVPSSSVIYYGTPVRIIVKGGSSYTWTPATGLDRNDNDTVYAAPSSTTVYSVHVVDAHQCSADTLITVRYAVGLNNQLSHLAFNADPNPFHGELRLQNLTDAALELHVFDVTGREITQAILNVGFTHLDTENWAPGIYLLKAGDTHLKVIKD